MHIYVNVSWNMWDKVEIIWVWIFIDFGENCFNCTTNLDKVDFRCSVSLISNILIIMSTKKILDMLIYSFLLEFSNQGHNLKHPLPMQHL